MDAAEGVTPIGSQLKGSSDRKFGKTFNPQVLNSDDKDNRVSMGLKSSINSEPEELRDSARKSGVKPQIGMFQYNPIEDMQKFQGTDIMDTSYN